MMDRSAIKAKLAALKKGNKQKRDIWKPAPGNNVIRMLPLKGSPDFPFSEILFHYRKGPKTLVSPLTEDVNAFDPIAAFGQELRDNSGNDKDMWIEGKQLEPTQRVYVPIIVRGKENEGVKFWGFGKRIYEELLTLLDDPDVGDVTDLESGRDITVEFLTKEQTGKSYPETKVRPKMAVTAASSNSVDLTRWVEEQPDIRTLFPISSEEQLQAGLEAYLNPETENESSSTQTPSTTNGPTDDEGTDAPATAKEEQAPTATKTEGVSTTEGVSEAFDALFPKEG